VNQSTSLNNGIRMQLDQLMPVLRKCDFLPSEATLFNRCGAEAIGFFFLRMAAPLSWPLPDTHRRVIQKFANDTLRQLQDSLHREPGTAIGIRRDPALVVEQHGLA